MPDQKIVWHVLQNYFKFVNDSTEWTGTDVVFDIGKTGAQTELRFTHAGLVPAYECYDVCSQSWDIITRSLYALITTGTGQPLTLEQSE